MTTARKIRRYIDRQLLDEASYDEDPFAEGLVDSLAVEQLLAFLEEEFEVTFLDEELVAENFATVEVLAALVDEKRSPAKRRRRNARTQAHAH